MLSTVVRLRFFSVSTYFALGDLKYFFPLEVTATVFMTPLIFLLAPTFKEAALTADLFLIELLFAPTFEEALLVADLFLIEELLFGFFKDLVLGGDFRQYGWTTCLPFGQVPLFRSGLFGVLAFGIVNNLAGEGFNTPKDFFY